MAVKIENGVTTLTPTAWKWFAGGVAIILMLPGFGLIVGGIFFLVGAGVLQRLVLTKDGLTVRNYFSSKTYSWQEIGDFRVHKVKSGLITAANMVSFTHANKEGTMMGKAAKMLVGGTHSVPAVGMPAKRLAQLMQAYKQGIVPQATLPQTEPSATVNEAFQAAPIPAPLATSAPSPKRPRAVPATPRAQNQTVRAKPKFGAKRCGSTPLVQEGGRLFGRRRSNSPFQS